MEVLGFAAKTLNLDEERKAGRFAYFKGVASNGSARRSRSGFKRG
jgi:hypothetical protein